MSEYDFLMQGLNSKLWKEFEEIMAKANIQQLEHMQEMLNNRLNSVTAKVHSESQLIHKGIKYTRDG